MTSSGRPPLVSIREVSVELGGRRVLNEISLDLREGEIVAVVGPNGSGKTTLLRAALGLVPTSSGRILIQGKDLRKYTSLPRARMLAWLPQSEGIHENLSVEEFVALGRYPHLGSFRREGEEDRTAVTRALLETDVLRFRHRGILDLSGGERQRVLLARSLAQGAPILLLDEPTNHLDMAYQIQVMQDLDQFRRSSPGRAVLVSIHDLNLASRFADRILWLKEGKTEALGTSLGTMTAERIYRVYGVDAEIHRSSEWVYVYPPRQRVVSVGSTSPGPRVHVVCGGGSGGEFLHRLAEAGFSVTAGALPLLDSDQETCAALRIPTAVEAPFTELSEDVRAENRSLMAKSQALVVAPLVVGPGNLANLLDPLPFVSTHPTFLVGGAPGDERDFTHGAARTAYGALLAQGAREVAREDLVPALRRATRATPPKTA